MCLGVYLDVCLDAPLYVALSGYRKGVASYALFELAALRFECFEFGVFNNALSWR